MLKTICIDDEEDARFLLIRAINKNHAHNFNIVGEADGVASGLALIEKVKPEVIFLDIQMRDGTGFDVISKITHNCAVIFLTAFDNYAIKAFKYSAFDYLLKPIKSTELDDTISRLIDSNKSSLFEQTKQLKSALENKETSLSIRDSSGIRIIDFSKIIRIEGQNQYSKIFTVDTIITTSKNLKHFEGLLENHNFYRVHNSHLINLKKVSKYLSVNGGSIELINGEIIPISRSRKRKVVDLLKK